MEATCSSETSVDLKRITLRYIPEDRMLHNHLCAILISHGINFVPYLSHIRTYHPVGRRDADHSSRPV
jgi:hypothetical protein